MGFFKAEVDAVANDNIGGVREENIYVYWTLLIANQASVSFFLPGEPMTFFRIPVLGLVGSRINCAA